MTDTHSTPTFARLAELTGGRLCLTSGAPVADDVAARPVASAAIDARDVPADGLFMAVPGTHDHGARFVGQSAGAGVLTDEAGLAVLATEGYNGPVLVVDDCRAWLGPVAAEIHGHPSRDMTVIGVTGTSGKTTTTYMMERALLGHRHVGLIGTTGTRIDGRPVPTSLTTPEAPTLQALFARMRDEGVTHVVMEVSSHALVLGRVRGVDIDVAAFTNLSQDHLDFHPTMEDYFAAKSLLFTGAQDPAGSLPTSVVCVDDEWGRRLADQLGRDTVTVATGGDASGDDTWQVRSVAVRPDGTQHITVQYPEGTSSFDLSVPGAFNVANATLALAALVAAGEDVSVAGRLAEVRVPGRMQKVTGTSWRPDFLALVDYAHKPGAVTAVLGTLNEQLDRAAAGQDATRGRLGVVLGAGGNRDHEKRPKMGAAAAAAADLVIVTDDNPRDEDPATIRDAVAAGARERAAQRTDGCRPELLEIGDRTAAIRAAVDWARTGDIIVIAGKGHETGQIIGDTVIDFDDRVVLADALDQRFHTEHKELQP
ncbi:UDP-N-acetylmuramoyl-L-alanyl-D-glutamate--2,6-diaminopimelate ligase [Corynebacterium terpenotabidum]|uniref:UDP-N-acetylmuramoyl-L-alanyl-D-glutamate--2,6-diaminopimelate ligase n=1 Tax=Corynebacterium terpenotabidum Y-11 TaxID=1200352 RepID=S4XDH3_9CORY|nr:UDP-N-acetylmuramoyl-L-alanyl-D-glutamate--2,6-diaminopimelate ligase [Corynebacterium terpenotabidum]AGP30579.1 UDP-N-acetylmuramoylalanyl-D-glutamate-2,6-diaminopimelate ligase [Corynebacterium terpenotabidum Y-11]